MRILSRRVGTGFCGHTGWGSLTLGSKDAHNVPPSRRNIHIELRNRETV